MLCATAVATAAPPALADGPGAGTPTVVTVGDSYISGEAGRWAGNSNRSAAAMDALGRTAYNDNQGGTAEAAPRCHRSSSAEAYFGAGTVGIDLACSGARTTTFTDSQGYFKPGLDFYSDSSGRQGQARALQQVAASHDVRMVVVSVGGNDFDFAGIVQTCVEDFLLSPSWWPNYCRDDRSVTAQFTSSAVTARRAAITAALRNVATAMRGAGYADNQWTLVVQGYPSPIPTSSGLRYPQSGYSRQSVGGCGFWNADATWANATALPTINSAVSSAAAASGLPNIVQLDLSAAFNGRRLCERGVGLLEEQGLASWRTPGAVDKMEWINQIRTVTTIASAYYIQESLHPNYWGQLALRECLLQVWHAGSPRGGACTIGGTGLGSDGNPRMTLR